MWHDYIECMMEFKGAKKAGIIFIESAEILAKSTDFNIKPQEVQDILSLFTDLELAKKLGIRVNGEKYHIIGAGTNIIYGTRLEPYYLTCVKTNKVILLLIGSNSEDRKAKLKAKSLETINIFEPEEAGLFEVKSDGALHLRINKPVDDINHILLIQNKPSLLRTLSYGKKKTKQENKISNHHPEEGLFVVKSEGALSFKTANKSQDDIQPTSPALKSKSNIFKKMWEWNDNIKSIYAHQDKNPIAPEHYDVSITFNRGSNITSHYEHVPQCISELQGLGLHLNYYHW